MIRLALTELRRLTTGRLPKLAVLALILVPLLYGSLYLYANSDPYQRLDRIPAALVVQDNGSAARKVADKLRSSKAFQWHQVSAEDAESGVRGGRYTFSLTLPADFSSALQSSADFTPRQGMITVTTNDANNYLVGTIADRVVGEVRTSVASEVSTEAANKFLIGFGTMFGKTQEAATGAAKLADGAATARDGAGQLAGGQRKLLDGAERLADGSATLNSALITLRDSTKSLPAQTAALADGAAKVAAGNEKIATTGEQVAGAAQHVVDHLDDLDAGIADRLRQAGLSEEQVQAVLADLRGLRKPVDDANADVQGVAGQLRTLANGAHRVADGAGKLAGAAPALAGGIGKAASGSSELAAGARQLRDGERSAVSGTDQLATGTGQLADGAAQLRDGLDAGLGQIPHPDDATRQATAKTIGDPLAVRTVADATAGSYGAGLAPFFLGLATWIGAFVLFLLVRPLSARALATGRSALRTALAGFLPAAALGLAQVVLLFTVVTTIVGIHPARPVAALGFLALTSLAFVAVLHALNALFGAVGKFLGLVILILQLISAGGTFPWQTLPDPLYPLHAVLPMGYVVDGLRHLLYGGSLAGVGTDVLVLAGYLVGGLAVSTLAARRQRVWTPSRLAPELVL
jgi:putative membrane protein